MATSSRHPRGVLISSKCGPSRFSSGASSSAHVPQRVPIRPGSRATSHSPFPGPATSSHVPWLVALSAWNLTSSLSSHGSPRNSEDLADSCFWNRRGASSRRLGLPSMPRGRSHRCLAGPAPSLHTWRRDDCTSISAAGYTSSCSTRAGTAPRSAGMVSMSHALSSGFRTNEKPRHVKSLEKSPFSVRRLEIWGMKQLALRQGLVGSFRKRLSGEQPRG